MMLCLAALLNVAYSYGQTRKRLPLYSKNETPHLPPSSFPLYLHRFPTTACRKPNISLLDVRELLLNASTH